MKNIQFLTVAEVIHMHRVQIMAFGGMHGIRDLGLLESAVFMPQAGIGETYLHEDIYAQAAAYMYHIVKNHPFFDGNKRTGALASLVFLRANGIRCTISNDQVYELAMQVATSKITKEQISLLLKKFSSLQA